MQPHDWDSPEYAAKVLDAKTLAERRKMQLLIRAQQAEAYRRRNTRALEQLQTWEGQITESIMRTEFSEFYNPLERA